MQRSRVVALSIGKPKWEDVRGHQVFTSIVRDASPDPLYFGPDGLAGNATAVHTEQVLAFSAEHYDYWAEHLGVARGDWGLCHWGENLTVLGFDENVLRIGDVLEIGPQARFEVTGPRNPCFKLAWRLGQPDSVLRPMVEKGFIGFYLSVLTPGLVTPGDKVVLTSPDPTAITVGDLARLLMGLGEATPDLLRRVVTLPALGGQARGMVSKKLTSIEDSERLKIGRWKGWRAFDVVETADEARDIRSFELAPVDGEPVAPYRAGQFLTVRLSGSEAGDAISRAWSLSDYQDHPQSYRVTIKRENPGAGSAWMHGITVPGRRVLVRPPAGRFTLDRGGFMRTVLISAGIGITPMLAMAKAHALRGDEAPPLLWLHVSRNGATHVRAREIDMLLKEQRYDRRIFYTDPRAEDVRGADYDEAGRLTAERLAKIVSSNYVIEPFGRPIDMEGFHSDFYICGPTMFEAEMRDALLALDVAEASIHSESFGIAGGTRAGAVVQKAKILFGPAETGIEWTAEEDLTLLELAEAQGLAPPYACRLGLCGACEAGLVAGDVCYDPAPGVAPPPGRVLLCCARPASPVVQVAL